MTPTEHCIAILDYPEALQSAVHGLAEMIGLADRLCREQDAPVRLTAQVVGMDGLAREDAPFAAIVVPPTLHRGAPGPVALEPIIRWLAQAHARGTVLCSACAGAFLLGACGVLDHRQVTTHWRLAGELQARVPAARVAAEHILVDAGDVITAGGLMAWVDLGLELVARFGSPTLMRALGRDLVVDTAPREQRFYQRFIPRLDHGDAAILSIQQALQRDSAGPVSVAALAAGAHMSERSLLRRFAAATGLSPVRYLQCLRVQRACELFEAGGRPVEVVAHAVGYEDVSAFRKIFARQMGLAPREFRRRFGPARPRPAR
jgi:transcriptional regulator GlxA family with amidase domain